ncbi:metallophosphoesterase [bacterium]|nr:metallophosphoesterase [candidate division CSSED10-310 bacterium]
MAGIGAALAAMGGTGLGTVMYAHFIEPAAIGLRVYRLPAAGLRHDLSIAHISDLHLRDDRYWRRKLVKTRAIFSCLAPDLVLLSGDFLECDNGLPLLEDLLSRLAPRFGMFAVWGNHDYYHYSFWHLFAPLVHQSRDRDHEHLAERMTAAGVTILHNRCVALDTFAGRLALFGVSDCYSHKDDLPRAMEDPPAADYRILLTHSPQLVNHVPRDTVDLLLAGHTHGGQIRLPGWGALASRSDLPAHMIRGCFMRNGMTVIIGNGLGEGRFVPFRLNCPPEVTWIRLAAAPSVDARVR